MDLNKNGLLFPLEVEFARRDNSGDTTLCLNSPGFGGSNISMFGGCKRNAGSNVSYAPPDDGCRLVLGLGPTPSTYSNDYLGFSLKTTSKELSTVEPPQGSESILQLCLSGGTKETSSISVLSGTEVNTCGVPSQVSPRNRRLLIPVVDEGSTSAKKSGGYMPSLLLAPRMDGGCSTISFGAQELIEFGTQSQLSEPSLSREYSVETFSEQETAGTNSDRRVNNPKKCKFLGCMKGARGATGLCIGHGGGQRCQKPSCNKGAESRTAYCKSHGGGKRCEHLGCTKSAEGKTEYCIAHGGGRRCGYQGCTKAARGKSGLCIRHGGGKRCKIEGCARSAEGQAGLCISHGGGRRCQRQGCTKGAQGSTMYCKAHGGGKRCVFQGCNKGAEGSTPLCKGHGGGKRCLFDGGGICPKSVHGGTNFCVAHGGGKRCAVPGCTKSARGRTDCCVKHGGGKRCRQESCGKSAQGSTDFCKAHGGGKRCCWGGEGKCEKFARGKSGLCAAHSSLMQERESGGKTAHGGLIGPRLFHGLVPAAVSTNTTNNSASAITVASDCIDSGETTRKRQQLIPPQVLVPLCMKTTSPTSSSTTFSSLMAAAEKADGRNRFDIGMGGNGGGGSGSTGRRSFEFDIPEGRVHGGPLMSLFGGNLNSTADGM